VKAFDDSRSKCLAHQFAKAGVVRWVIQKNGVPRLLDVEAYLLWNRRQRLRGIHAGEIFNIRSVFEDPRDIRVSRDIPGAGGRS
jgi:hypothetical protein